MSQILRLSELQKDGKGPEHAELTAKHGTYVRKQHRVRTEKMRAEWARKATEVEAKIKDCLVLPGSDFNTPRIGIDEAGTEWLAKVYRKGLTFRNLPYREDAPMTFPNYLAWHVGEYVPPDDPLLPLNFELKAGLYDLEMKIEPHGRNEFIRGGLFDEFYTFHTYEQALVHSGAILDALAAGVRDRFNCFVGQTSGTLYLQWKTLKLDSSTEHNAAATYLLQDCDSVLTTVYWMRFWSQRGYGYLGLG